MKLSKKLTALFAAVLMAVTVFTSAIPAYATTQKGTSGTFGNWECETTLSTDNAGKKYYYSDTTCGKAGKLTVESEYQKYPSGVQYKYQSNTSANYNALGVALKLVKTQQSTVWSFHNWKSSSGTGMTKYTELINQ